MADQYAGYQQQVMGFPMAPPVNPYAQRGQTDLMLLMQLAQGFAPVVTAPAPQMRTGFESLPGFNQPGMTGFLMNQFVAPQLQKMMGRHGMVPGGLSTQNIVDYQAAQQFQEDQKFILRQSAQQDEGSYYQTIKGMQALTGQPFNAPQRAAARRLASTAAGMTPSIAPLAPELIDAMAGRTGSAAVMAMRMQQFNRYKVDPATGLTGYSRESNAAEAEQVFNEMYKPDNMANMRGMRAGQMGQMYGEMMRRGMIGSDPRSMRERVVAATGQALGGDPANAALMRETLGLEADAEIDPQKLDGGQLDKLRGLESVQGNLRTFNGAAVKSSLQGYVDAVTTMREIFGDAGISNAPMSQLVQGLEALSQGTMTQIDPGSLNMMVRTTQQLAKQSGMTIDAAIMMQQQGATTLQNLGVERNFAPQVTQGAMAFGQAAQQAGVGANPAWGLENMDFQRQLDQNLRSAAIASPAFNSLSALVRAEEDFGGFGDRQGVGEGRENETGAEFQARTTEFERRAQAMSTAIQDGQTEYSFVDDKGKAQTANLYDDQFMAHSMLIEQGRNQGLTQEGAAARANNILMQRAANRETGFRHKVGGVVRRLQPEDVKRQLLQPAAEGILRGQEGVDVGKASKAFADAVLSQDRATATNKESRTDAFVAAIRPHVARRAGESEENYDTRLRSAANQMEGQVNERIHDPNSQYSSYQHLQNLMVQQSPETLVNTAITRRRAELDAGVRDAMAGLTGHGALANLVTAVQGAGEDKDRATMIDVLGATFGGVRAGEIADRLQKPMADYQTSIDAVTQLEKKFSMAETSDDKRKVLNDLEVEKDLLKTRSNQLRTTAEQHGLLEQEGTLDITDLEDFYDADETVRQNRLTSAALLLRPDAGMTPADRLKRGEAAGLLNPVITDDKLIAALLLDEDGNEIKPINGVSRRELLDTGKANLTDTELLKVLDFRQNEIRITPTEAEVTAAMPEGLKDNEKARRLFAGAISTERRLKKTGDTQAALEARTKGMVLSGIDPAIFDNLKAPDKARLLLAQREEKSYFDATGKALAGGIDAMAQRDVAWETMTPEDRAMVGRGWQTRFEQVQHVIDETGGANEIRRTGGRGLQLRDELKKTQGTSARLKNLFGSAGALAMLKAGVSEAQRTKFADYVETEGLDQFFDAKGKLKDKYAVGDLAGKTREDFNEESLTNRAMLGARHAQFQNADNEKRREEIVKELSGMVGMTDMGFTKGISKEDALKQASRLLGKGVGDKDVVATAKAMQQVGGLERGEGKAFDAVQEAARSKDKIEDIEVPEGYGDDETLYSGGTAFLPGFLSDRPFESTFYEDLKSSELPADHPNSSAEKFKRDVEAVRRVRSGVEGAATRAEIADLSDPSKALSQIGTSLGLKGDELEKLRSDPALAKMSSTSEGQAWAREISESAKTINAAAGENDKGEVYSAISAVIAGGPGKKDAEKKLRDLTGREGGDDIQDLVGSGRMLKHTGLLDDMAGGKGGSDLTAAIKEALKALQKSQQVVADVKPQHITIDGTLDITGDPNVLRGQGKTLPA